MEVGGRGEMMEGNENNYGREEGRRREGGGKEKGRKEEI
jgi:hypothetical protein